MALTPIGYVGGRKPPRTFRIMANFPDLVALSDGNFQAAPGTYVGKAIESLIACLHSQGRDVATLNHNDTVVAVRSNSNLHDILEKYEMLRMLRKLEGEMK
jgi:hypothetical protein